MKVIYTAILGFFLASPNALSLVSLSGHSTFGPSIQKDAHGGRNTFSFDPALALNTMIPVEGWTHFFTPEVGIVINSQNQNSDYSKYTTYFLLDLGHPLPPHFLLRYGIGFFITSIKGEGGTTRQKNGNEYFDFTRPGTAVNSYNLTINIGIERQILPEWSIRFETFAFSMLDQHARNISYSLGINFYPF